MAETYDDIDTTHEYDGIREYDNRLPNWWLMTLHGAIVFSVAYWLYFHTFGVGVSAHEALQLELAEAQQAAERREEQRIASEGALTDETLTDMSKQPEAVARGREVYAQNCLACHGASGEGTVGPNLTDPYWIHGGKPTQIHDVIAGGKLEKGMPSWRPVLGAARVRDVTAFLLTLRDSNLPGKAPQGLAEDAPDPAPGPTAQAEAPGT